MSMINIGVLSLILVAFVGFAAVLAIQSHRSK